MSCVVNDITQAISGGANIYEVQRTIAGVYETDEYLDITFELEKEELRAILGAMCSLVQLVVARRTPADDEKANMLFWTALNLAYARDDEEEMERVIRSVTQPCSGWITGPPDGWVLKRHHFDDRVAFGALNSTSLLHSMFVCLPREAATKYIIRTIQGCDHSSRQVMREFGGSDYWQYSYNADCFGLLSRLRGLPGFDFQAALTELVSGPVPSVTLAMALTHAVSVPEL